MYRTIDARFWTDPKVRELSPKNKLLFMYFITSPHAHFSGLYYVPETTISYETGMKPAEIAKGLDTLSIGYLVRIDTLSDLVWVVNMFRYQSHSKKLLTNIGTHLSELHKSPLIGAFLDHYSELEIPYRYPIDTLCNKEQRKEQEQEENKEQNKEQNQDSDKTDANDFTATDSVIDHLNEKTGSSFRHSEASRKNISARLAESFTIDDCILVVDFKQSEWAGTEFDKYLTPETLFRPTKFENNLNAAKKWAASGRKKPSGNGNGKAQKDRFGTEPPVSDYENVGRAA